MINEYDVTNSHDYEDFISYMKENFDGLSESVLEEAEYQVVKRHKFYYKNYKKDWKKIK